MKENEFAETTENGLWIENENGRIFITNHQLERCNPKELRERT